MVPLHFLFVCVGPLLTVLVLHHDRVAERQQLEELRHVLVLAGPDAGHQRMIHKLELSICKLVPAPVDRLVEKKKSLHFFFLMPHFDLNFWLLEFLSYFKLHQEFIFICNYSVSDKTISYNEFKGTSECLPRCRWSPDSEQRSRVRGLSFLTLPRSSVTPSAVVGSPGERKTRT